MLPCLWSQTWKIYLLPPRSLGLESINYFAGAGHSRRRLARLAQSAERKTLNLVVVGSSPTLGETHLNATFHEPLLVQLIRRLFWIFLCLTVPRLMEDCFIPQPRWQTTQDFYFTKADPQNPSVRLLPFILTGFIRTLIDFFSTSGVQLGQPDRDQFGYRRVAFSSQLKSKVGNILAKAAVLWITLNIDGVPISSKSHTHPSHSETSRLLTSSLSLVPVFQSPVQPSVCEACRSLSFSF